MNKKYIVSIALSALMLMFSFGYVVASAKKDAECKQTTIDNTYLIEIVMSYGETLGNLQADGYSDEQIETYVSNNCVPLVDYVKGK